ncbi:DUF3037 domain-containing protein [Vreelandella venusta]|uniref:DUF3037 domain-containing protein n=1 Tax=Vreelandella venusta TaxID=44935 RepID=A0ABX2BBQ0_9GAMM|nr:DUF3037 domain-containing protein [Halomonas venusta]AZM95854.1 DUF3037 domain-containing protein [Halomonas venusta]NPT30868.1 hypothetical protein [Halomonas venusta]
MSIANRLLKNLQQNNDAPEVKLMRGRWFNIRLQPNLLAGEYLNVGVGFVDQTGRLHTRFTDNLSRLRCLYDDRVDIEDMQMLMGLAADQFDRERYESDMPKSISPQLSFSPPSYAAGASIDDILNTFFYQTVSLVPPLEEPETSKRPNFRGYTNAAVRKELFQWMFKHNQQIASRIFADNSTFKIRASDGGRSEEHSLDLPLRQPNKLAGSVVSAYCGLSQTAEIRLLQSAMSINTAKRHLDSEKIGLFVLRPDHASGLDKKTLGRFDDMIDENIWQLRDAGVHVGVEPSVERLGKEIAEWAA